MSHLYSPQFRSCFPWSRNLTAILLWELMANWAQDGQTIGSYCLPMAYYPSHKLAFTPKDVRDTGQFSLVLRYSEHPVQTPHQER